MNGFNRNIEDSFQYLVSIYILLLRLQKQMLFLSTTFSGTILMTVSITIQKKFTIYEIILIKNNFQM